MMEISITLQKDQGVTSRKRDESEIQKVTCAIKKMDKLLCTETHPEICNSRMTADHNGHISFVTFVQKQLVSGEVPFHMKLPKLPLKTFSDMKSASNTKTAAPSFSLKSDRSRFAKMIVIAHHRHLNMLQILKYQLGTLPWSLANAKDTLLHVLEGLVDPVKDIISSAVLILYEIPSVSWQTIFFSL